MSEGLSFESFAAEANVCIDTIKEWSHAHPEFSASKKLGTAASLLHWEKLGQKGIKGEIEKFSASTWIFTMKCRFRNFGYRDEPQVQDPNTKELKEAVTELGQKILDASSKLKGKSSER